MVARLCGADAGRFRTPRHAVAFLGRHLVVGVALVFGRVHLRRADLFFIFASASALVWAALASVTHTFLSSPPLSSHISLATAYVASAFATAILFESAGLPE